MLTIRINTRKVAYRIFEHPFIFQPILPTFFTTFFPTSFSLIHTPSSYLHITKAPYKPSPFNNKHKNMPPSASPQQLKPNPTISSSSFLLPQTPPSTTPYSPYSLYPSPSTPSLPTTDGPALRRVQARTSYSAVSQRELGVEMRKGFRGKVARQVRSLKRGVDGRAMENRGLKKVWGRISGRFYFLFLLFLGVGSSCLVRKEGSGPL